MNILIEGPDCAGKSTLAKELKNNLCFDLISLHHKKEDQTQRYLKMYSSLDNTVFERGHISEIVYSRLYNRSIPFSAQQKDLLQQLVSYNFLIIHACPSIEDMKKRYVSREHVHQSTKLEELITCRQYFIEEMDTYPNVVLYNSHNFQELTNLVSHVKERIL